MTTDWILNPITMGVEDDDFYQLQNYYLNQGKKGLTMPVKVQGGVREV